MRKQINNIELATLPNGLRLACCRYPGAQVEYCGIVVRVGSRDDGEKAPGLAHFVEHTIFKGTAKRSSWHVINRMERVGGELNAYTTKEETVVYTAAPTGNLSRAMELIADLASTSRFPAAELDKEREVVADEINSYLDTPSEAVYDDFEELIFAGTPLAHNILGNVEALETFDTTMCQEYLRRWYAIPNVAVFYSGPAGIAAVSKIMERYFAVLPAAEPARVQYDMPPAQPFSRTKEIGSHQAHTVMGCIVPGMYYEHKHDLALITNILGGPGMNSRLNVELREKRGLVYSVEASTSLLTDCGLFNIYFGCDPADREKCEELVRQQLRKMAAEPLTPRELAMAKRQYIGQLAVAGDNRESMAISAGRAAMYWGYVLSRQEIIDKINCITPERLMETARQLLDVSSLTLQ